MTRKANTGRRATRRPSGERGGGACRVAPFGEGTSGTPFRKDFATPRSRDQHAPLEEGGASSIRVIFSSNRARGIRVLERSARVGRRNRPGGPLAGSIYLH